MDRANSEKFPSMQVSYIDEICLPVYSSLAAFSEPLAPMLEGCKSNRSHWSSLIGKKEVEGEDPADEKAEAS